MPVVNYDWDELEDNIVEEYDDAGVTIADYTTEPDHFGNVISQHRGGQSRFFHYDGQGSTVAVTDGNQSNTDVRAYSAFGETTEDTGITLFPFQYVGEKGYYNDILTGEYLARTRPHRPIDSRWLSVDSLYLAANTVGPYVYSLNNPLRYFDASGLQPEECDDKGNCCCCVTDDFGFESRTLLVQQPEFPERYLWGHYLTVRARFDLISHSRGEGRGCRLEWWECSTLEGNLGQRPGEWDPAHAREGFSSPPHSNLDEYYEGPLKCGGVMEIHRKDEPKLPFPRSRILKFALRLISEGDCPCMFSSFWMFFTQTLDAGANARIDPFDRKKPAKGWKRWDIDHGIDDGVPPKACTQQKVMALSDG